MSGVMAEKLNSGFIMRLYAAFQSVDGHKPTRIETLIEGLIYSMTRSNRACNVGYSWFTKKLNVCKSSVAAALDSLAERGKVKIKRRGGKNSEYTYVGEIEKAAHVRTERFFCTEKFDVAGEARYLTNAEVDVLSLIYTHTRRKDKQKFVGSVREIAAILNLSERTVERAMIVLFAAELVFRTSKGKNRYQKSEFCANMKLLRYLEKKHKKQEKQESKAVIDANAKADRERYYAKMDDRKRSLAERYAAQANKNPRFVEVTREFAKLARPLAEAELRGYETLPTLQAKEKALEAERALILSKLGIEPWQLEAEAHARCEKCRDTGTLPNGRYCDCWKFET